MAPARGVIHHEPRTAYSRVGELLDADNDASFLTGAENAGKLVNFTFRAGIDENDSDIIEAREFAREILRGDTPIAGNEHDVAAGYLTRILFYDVVANRPRESLSEAVRVGRIIHKSLDRIGWKP